MGPAHWDKLQVRRATPLKRQMTSRSRLSCPGKCETDQQLREREGELSGPRTGDRRRLSACESCPEFFSPFFPDRNRDPAKPRMAHSEAKGIKKMLLDNSLFVRLYSLTVEEPGRTGGLDSIAAQALTDLRHPFTFLPWVLGTHSLSNRSFRGS
jgi:hypothetical protein